MNLVKSNNSRCLSEHYEMVAVFSEHRRWSERVDLRCPSTSPIGFIFRKKPHSYLGSQKMWLQNKSKLNCVLSSLFCRLMMTRPTASPKPSYCAPRKTIQCILRMKPFVWCSTTKPVPPTVIIITTTTLHGEMRTRTFFSYLERDIVCDDCWFW